MIKKTKRTNENTSPPKRVAAHKIDTLATRFVETNLPADWVKRTVTDRDYGIDILFEYLDNEETTGLFVIVQVKGQQKSFSKKPVTDSVPVKTLLYAQMFQNPFILVTVSLDDNQAYFVWLQKYINTRLINENRRWDKQDWVTIEFPEDNLWNKSGLEKIHRFAQYAAHRDLGITYMHHYNLMKEMINAFQQEGGKSALEQALVHLRELSRLSSFFEVYDSDNNFIDLVGIKNILAKAKAYDDFDDGDHEFLDDQLLNMHALERTFLAQNEIDAFMTENVNADFPY